MTMKQTKPPITRTNHILPFEKLSSDDFERMCLWLVKREGYLQVRHLGAAGSEQGRDIIAYKKIETNEELWYFQCKRYKKVSVSIFEDEINKYNQLVKSDTSKRPMGIVFITNAIVSANISDKVTKKCQQYGYKCEFWARTELDMYVKRHDDVVREFFGQEQVDYLKQDNIIEADKDLLNQPDESYEASPILIGVTPKR